MASVSLLSSSSSSPAMSALKFHPFSRKPRLNFRRRPSSWSPTRVFAWKRDAQDQNYNGRIVDESMIVLRKRIHEMKMVERNYEPPQDWMEWEKKYYTTYDAMICNFMGFLQTQLMEMRPSVALGMLALITLSVPTSMAVLVSNLLEISKGIVSGTHLL